MQLEAGKIVLASTNVSNSCEDKPNINHGQYNKGFVNDYTKNSIDKTQDELNIPKHDKINSEENILQGSNEVYTIRDNLEPCIVISKSQNLHSNETHANNRPESVKKLSLKDVVTDRILLKFVTIGGLLW